MITLNTNENIQFMFVSQNSYLEGLFRHESETQNQILK